MTHLCLSHLWNLSVWPAVWNTVRVLPTTCALPIPVPVAHLLMVAIFVPLSGSLDPNLQATKPLLAPATSSPTAALLEVIPDSLSKVQCFSTTHCYVFHTQIPWGAGAGSFLLALSSLGTMISSISSKSLIQWTPPSSSPLLVFFHFKPEFLT